MFAIILRIHRFAFPFGKGLKKIIQLHSHWGVNHTLWLPLNSCPKYSLLQWSKQPIKCCTVKCQLNIYCQITPQAQQGIMKKHQETAHIAWHYWTNNPFKVLLGNVRATDQATNGQGRAQWTELPSQHLCSALLIVNSKIILHSSLMSKLPVITLHI